MVTQPVDAHRCASCERWSGPRQKTADPDFVTLGSETDTGICRGGPWDGSERRARSACGRWIPWSELGGGREVR